MERKREMTARPGSPDLIAALDKLDAAIAASESGAH